MACTIKINFPLKNGLHARPASLIQETARKFEADIFWENDRARTCADCKSTLSLIATDTRQNDPCQITASGSDEQKAGAAIKKLVEITLPRTEARSSGQEIPSAGSRVIPRIIQKENPLCFSGVTACQGISRGTAYVFDPVSIRPPTEPDSPVMVENELSTFQAALESLEREIASSRQNSQNRAERDILKTHLSILQDKTFREEIRNHIFGDTCTAAMAVYRSSLHFSQLLQNSKSVYIRQRMADIKDISMRLISRITGNPEPRSELILAAPSVLVAVDISPSLFMAQDKNLLKGLVLASGGTASHSLILARSFNIPSITGIPQICKKINSGEEVVVDGDHGLVIPSPSPSVLRFYDKEIEKKEKIKAKAIPFISVSGATSDGKKLEVAANISSIEEIETAFANGAEGIGLFRSEMIFLNRTTPPEEEEQLRIYSRAARIAGKRPIIIRTLDIGGDKPVPYLNLPAESNPFLGRRAVRLYDQLPDIIDCQLRALLRASVSGNLKIMFPMVSCYEEVITLKKRLQKVTGELKNQKIPCNSEISIGIMVEIPSLVFAMDELCREIDFFSIGSNDLLQYFLAIDRSNPDLDYLSKTIHPSFLRLLKKIIDAAHSHHKWIGICGEMAGDIRLLPVMVGLGFDEISLSSPKIPMAKFRLNQLQSLPCKNLVSRLLEESTAQGIDRSITGFDANPAESVLISVQWVRLDSRAESREEAIRELIDLLDIEGRLYNIDDVEEALWQRESVYSTGIGFGIAIPHCRSARVRTNSIAFSRLANPIPWQSPDNRPVDTVILLALAAGEPDKEHLKIISRLSRKLMDEIFRLSLHKAKKPEDIIVLINECLETNT